MQSQSGHVVSDQFLRELRSVTQDSETALIVDATETGCGATGKSFWGFNGSADYLVFGKRTQVEGFYSRPQSKSAAVALGGDHLRLLQFQVINEVMTKDRLIDKVDVVGASLRKQVQSAVSKNSDITGVRGLGTSLYIDTKDANTSHRLQQFLLKEGILTKLSGNAVALKPSLTLEQKHVDQFTAALSKF